MRDPRRCGAAWPRVQRHHAGHCDWRRRGPDGHAPHGAVDAGARLAPERPDAHPRTTGQGHDWRCLLYTSPSPRD
eukprot:3986714-Alexandrium_andersonii.AAC.1